MRARVGIGVATVASVLAAVFAPIGAPGNGVAQAAGTTRSSTALAIQDVPIHSSYENDTRVVSRDDGISVALPDGHDLWLFGDTGIYQRNRADGSNWKLTGFIDGSTALEARYTRGQVPHGGEYPSGVPARFVPVPHDVYLPDGSGRPCTYQTADFPARWPTGAAVMASDTAEVLVTYAEVCITPLTATTEEITAEGWGYMLYNWQTHHIDTGPVDVHKPAVDGTMIGPAQIFGSPVFGNGKLTLFAELCTSFFVACSKGHVWSVSMPDTTSALNNPASYRPTQLQTDGTTNWQPLSISVGRYSTGSHTSELRVIELTSIDGTYEILSAPSIGSPWHLDGKGTLPGCPTPTGFCFALAGHPELSTPTEIFLSYADPVSGPGGHVVVSAVSP